MVMGQALIILPDGSRHTAEFCAGEAYRDVGQRLDELVAPGWIMHQIDAEIGAACLMKSDGAPRNHHAEAIIRSLGTSSAPMLFGRVGLIGLSEDKTLPAWQRFTSLDEFYFELIDHEHQLVPH